MKHLRSSWQKALLGASANSQYHKVGIDGGAGETRFNLFYSFNNDEGIMMNSGAKKHVTSLNLVHTGNKMKATGRINYSEQAIYGVGTSEGNSYFNQLQGLIFYRPTYGITGNDDDFVNLDEDPFLADDGAGDYFHSPITNALSQHRNSINKVLFMNGTIEYKLFKHLTYRGLVNVGTTSLKRDQFNDYRSSIAKRSGAPNGMIDGSSRNSWNYSNTLTYRDVFNKVHKLDVLVGQEQNYRQVSTNRITATGFPWETRGLDNLSEAAAFIVQSDKEDERLFSLFSRVNYSYKSRYLLSASFRADGSSKFGADNKYGYFPAAALAWRVTEEPFMRNQQLFSDVKFRFSIGTTGNNRIRNYSSLALLRTGNYPLNDNNNVSVYSNTLPNPALKWEQTRSTNIGLDLAVLRNRLQLTTELYRNRTTDLLLNADVPSITGYSTMLINVGSTSNHGLELTLSSINVDQSHFKWTTNLNIAFNRNKVLGLTSGSDLMYANSAWGVLSENDYLINVGRSLGQIYGYKADGLYQVDEFDYDATNGTYTLKEGIAFDVNNIPRPGFLKLIDQNGDLAINSDDRVIIGNANPRHIGGLNNTFSYKGFDLGVFINWSYGNQVYNANKLNMSQTHLDYRNTLAYVADRWMSIDAAGSRITDPVVLKESNAGKTVPVYNGAGAALRLHDGVIEDGSFLRINNINLGV